MTTIFILIIIIVDIIIVMIYHPMDEISSNRNYFCNTIFAHRVILNEPPADAVESLAW